MTEQTFDPFTSMPPIFGGELPIIDGLRGRIERLGSLSLSVHEIFKEADISVAVEGDTSRWCEPGQGVVLYGDHSQRVEYIPLTALLGEMGRDSAHILSKPYARTAHAIHSLSAQASEVILPVVPKNLASDRGNILNRNLYYRLLRGKDLPTGEQIRALNKHSTERCVELASSGEAVNIYPTGSVRSALSAPWYEGIGRIVKLLPEPAWSQVMLVPFQFDRFSTQALLRSIGMYRRPRVARRPECLTMRLGEQGTPQELLGDGIDQMSAAQITATLRKQYINVFGRV